uniref:Uncharacterized protein n=1 Tax=Arundo donax TaxID=35708 RepID=A0A0A9CAE8_ARUDO
MNTRLTSLTDISKDEPPSSQVEQAVLLDLVLKGLDSSHIVQGWWCI